MFSSFHNFIFMLVEEWKFIDASPKLSDVSSIDQTYMLNLLFLQFSLPREPPLTIPIKLQVICSSGHIQIKFS